MDNRKEWALCRDELVSAIVSLGFPMEFGDQIAKQLGSPKAMQRMTGYLNNVKPHSAELIADEMLSICTEIDRWKEKKACEEAKSWLCYYKALQIGDSSKVVPIDKLSVIITILLAFIFLHEDFTIL